MTEELVEKILLPGLEAGAVDVFLEFICYSGGPLPEELLPLVKVKFLMLPANALHLLSFTYVLVANTFCLFLINSMQCPVLVAWGDKDPWEPIDLGRAYGNFESVEDFVVLPNVGHCPQVSLTPPLMFIFECVLMLV